MALHTWRGSIPVVSIVALMIALGYTANPQSAGQLLLLLAMGVMSALIMMMFRKRPLPLPIPLRVQIPVHHE